MTSITAFTPAPSCFAPTYTVAPLGNDTVADLTAIRGYATECMPFTPEPTGYPTMQAVNCLGGYEQQTGRQSTNGESTYGTCCPSGMTVQSTSTQMCSSVTGYNSVTVINATQTTSVHANFLVAPALVMAWRSEDLASLTTSTSSSTPVAPIAPIATQTIPTLTPTNTSGSDNSLPKADTIRHTVVLAVSIAIACLVAVGIVCAIAALVLARKRQRKKALGQVQQDLPPAYEARNSQSSEALPSYVAGSKSETLDVK